MAKQTMDNVRAGGRRHDAGQRVRVQHAVADTSRVRRGERCRAGAAHRASAALLRPSAAAPRPRPQQPCRRSRPATPSWTRHCGADKPFNGKKVSIQTQWIGGEGTNFAASLADFARATGIKIQVDSIGSSHETVLKTRIEGGQPPDLAHARPADARPGLRRGRQGHRRRDVHGRQEAQR